MADPFDIVTGTLVEPNSKVMVPVGVGKPTIEVTTVAVKVMFCPAVEGFGELVNVTDVPEALNSIVTVLKAESHVVH